MRWRDDTITAATITSGQSEIKSSWGKKIRIFFRLNVNPLKKPSRLTSRLKKIRRAITSLL